MSEARVPIVVDGPDDPRVADYWNIREAALTRARGLFVAEGRFVVERLLRDGRFSVRSVLLSPSAYQALAPALASLPESTSIYTCRAKDFRSIAGFNFHRGCLALGERPAPVAFEHILAFARTLVVLEDVVNADNVGGVYRNAAAFGVDAVVLSQGTCDPFYRKAIRTSMAATLRVPSVRLEHHLAGLELQRSAGFALVALTPREPSQPLDSFLERTAPERVALLVGSEGSGLSEASLAMADLRVRIPTAPLVDSLNVAVATGIVLARLSARGMTSTCSPAWRSRGNTA